MRKISRLNMTQEERHEQSKAYYEKNKEKINAQHKKVYKKKHKKLPSDPIDKLVQKYIRRINEMALEGTNEESEF